MKKIVTIIAIIIVIAISGLGAWYFLNSPSTYSGKTESIIIGLPPTESAALFFISEDQRFFTENGLNVTIRYYDTGIGVVQAMENNEVDLSGSTEYPIVAEAFKNKNISVICYDDRTQTFYCIGRKDRGIENVSDLRGKKIGLSRGTMSEFYLGRFLDLHGIDPRDVDIVDVSPDNYMNATVNGEVDAIVCWQPYVDAIQSGLGNDSVIWPVQNSQLVYGVIACRNDWAAVHPETINRFLKAMSQAEAYTIAHPEEAKSIDQKNLNFSDPFMNTVWQNNQFSLSLDQSLVTAMEDEGRWMIANNLTTERTIPDFRKYIYAKGMKSIKPESVNIIG